MTETRDLINPKKYRLGGVYDPIYPLLLLRSGLRLGGETSVTAIGLISRPEGFIIGADGFRQTTDEALVAMTAQKVFNFQTGNAVLAYAWCGRTVIWNEDNPEEVFFDFGANTKPVLTVASYKASNFNDFAEIVRGEFFELLNTSNYAHPGWISAAPPGSIARMLVAGYFHGEAFSMEINAQQINYLPRVAVKLLSPSNNLKMFSGCPNVEEDERLLRTSNSIEDARNLIHEYVRRCIDAPNCKGIGGHVHVALISPQCFRWIDEPDSRS